MCGIVGAISFNNFTITSDYLIPMRDTMLTRGPDGAGLWISPNHKVGLAHRRLSIIDLSTSAAQPMSTYDGSLWLTFNGEIYNHREIRAELKALGHNQWKTDHSDTEVILHAFAEWGIDCLHKFRGMFAFALWDERKQELWLVRDRIGIKPLYYSFHHNRLTFASEIKALLQDPEQERAVDEESLFYYLSFFTTPAPRTLFAGIQKLEPGTWLKISRDGKMTKQRYWDVWDHVSPLKNASEAEIAERISSELRTAVKLRKESDVATGVFLSGGIDSSTNAALFNEGSAGPIHTFSIGYQGEYQTYQNELQYARKMANLIGAQYHERLLTIDDLIDFLPEMVHLQDEPIGDPVCVPVYYVSKLAKDNGVTVCQVGEGSDELFCGYESWQTYLKLQKLANIPGTGFLKQGAKQLFKLFNRTYRNEYELLSRAADGHPIFWGGAQGFSAMQKSQVLSPRLREKFKNLSAWNCIEPIWNRYQEKAWEKSSLHWMSYLDLSYRLPELLLMRVDKMSMGVSVEGRVPFLDHKFVELGLSIPTAIKTKNNNPKYILKKAVRGLIPDELIDRKKQGFGVPIYEWFFDRLGDKAKQDLQYFCDKTDFLDSKEVMRLVDQKAGTHAWLLLNLAAWWKEYIDEPRSILSNATLPQTSSNHHAAVV